MHVCTRTCELKLPSLVNASNTLPVLRRHHRIYVPLFTGLCESTKEAVIVPAFCRYVQSTLFIQTAKSRRTKEEKQRIISNIIDIINALLNEGRGILCIHSEDSYFLDKFHELLDDLLNSMLTDGSLFDENFERICDFSVDSFRVVYGIKPRIRVPPITRDFKTKASLDKGVTELMFHQFQTLLRKVSTTESCSSENAAENADRKSRDQYNFVDKAEVKHFVESRNRQAKRFPPSEHGNLPVLNLVDSVWELLSKYISAFSKNKDGGSVFFGIREEHEEPTRKWRKVRTKQFPMLEILDSNWKVWENNEASVYYVAKEASTLPRTSLASSPAERFLAWKRLPSREVEGVVRVTDESWALWEGPNDDAYHVAAEAGVPVLKEQPTGKFLCEGRRLSRPEQNFLEGKILRNVREKLLWLGRQVPEEPVTVTFHPVRDERDEGVLQDVYVVEVVVKPFHGIVFTDTEGPTSRRVDPAGGEVVSMEFSEWLSAQRTQDEFQRRIPWYRWPSELQAATVGTSD